jgi:uncharacterized cupin superfamily protein
VHADADEVSYVLAGEITAEIGGEVSSLRQAATSSSPTA